jgi:hypothetical protein
VCQREQNIGDRNAQRRGNNGVFDDNFRRYPGQDYAQLSDHLSKLALRI